MIFFHYPISKQETGKGQLTVCWDVVEAGDGGALTRMKVVPLRARILKTEQVGLSNILALGNLSTQPSPPAADSAAPTDVVASIILSVISRGRRHRRVARRKSERDWL
jgi:hypothetical protein